VAAILTCTDVWGEPGRDKDLKAWKKGGKVVKPSADDAAFEDIGQNRFSKTPLVLYRPEKGDTLFGLQVQPKLPDAEKSTVDYLVIVDTSASKAMGPLAVAGQISDALIKLLGPEDRAALWTANLKPKDLSRGFKSGKDLAEPLKTLAKEIPLGA